MSTTMADASTVSALADYIRTDATDTDLDTLIDAINARRKYLRASAALALTPGAAIRIENVSPKYLSGLTGTFLGAKGNRARIRFDAKSTIYLRAHGRRFMTVPADVTEVETDVFRVSHCVPAVTG
jgi:hypothetical protein